MARIKAIEGYLSAEFLAGLRVRDGWLAELGDEDRILYLRIESHMLGSRPLRAICMGAWARFFSKRGLL
jgi:hypothetical protein